MLRRRNESTMLTRVKKQIYCTSVDNPAEDWTECAGLDKGRDLAWRNRRNGQAEERNPQVNKSKTIRVEYPEYFNTIGAIHHHEI